jgi:hypothetical protein
MPIGKLEFKKTTGGSPAYEVSIDVPAPNGTRFRYAPDVARRRATRGGGAGIATNAPRIRFKTGSQLLAEIAKGVGVKV